MNAGADLLDPATVRRIVVRGVNWLGDAVMTTPALIRLRERFVGAEIILITQRRWEELWQGHPAVDRVVSFDRGDGVFRVARHIRQQQADLGLIFPNSGRSGLEMWLARVGRRVGIASPGRRWLLTVPVPPDPLAVRMRKRTAAEIRSLVEGKHRPEPIPAPEAHHLYHYLRLVAALGANPLPLRPVLNVSASEREAARQTFLTSSSPGSSSPVWIGINPGAEYGPSKRWPAENFGRLIELSNAHARRLSWVVFGGASDLATARQVTESAGGQVVNLAGRTRLRELMAVLAECRVLVTNDTGPMHVASALGVPVVVPFGSTSPELTGPGLPGDSRNRLVRNPVPCSPCFLRQCPIDLRCLRGITPEQLARALERALEPLA